MSNEYILKIENLNKKYDTFSLKNINLKLEPGSIMGFIGANGAGKSTTIKSILNIIQYDSGKIFINNMESKKHSIEINQDIGYFGDEINLYSDSCARHVYKFIKKFYRNWDDDIFNNLINTFNLNINKKIKEFSKGMKVQFMLSLALSHHAKLFILDEPTSGLDPIIRGQILDTLYNTVKAENASVLFSSHITEDIQKIADKITYIDSGKILLSDSKDNILNMYKKIRFKKDIPIEIKKQFFFNHENASIIHVNDMEKIETVMVDNKIDFEDIIYSTPLLDEILIYLKDVS